MDHQVLGPTGQRFSIFSRSISGPVRDFQDFVCPGASRDEPSFRSWTYWCWSVDSWFQQCTESYKSIFSEMKNGVFIFEDFEPNIVKFKVFDQSNNTVIKCGENSISIRNIQFDFIIYTGTNISNSDPRSLIWPGSMDPWYVGSRYPNWCLF